MYLKYIICDVKKDKINEFSLAQEQWSQSAVAEGFVAQLGGWNTNNQKEACILSFWEHPKYLENFMANFHDQISENNQQKETYNSIQIKHFQLKTKLNKEAIVEMVENSRNLFIVDYLFQSKLSKKLKSDMHYVTGIDNENSSHILKIIFSDKHEISEVFQKEIEINYRWKVR